MQRSIIIEGFIRKIECLPSDQPVHNPREWYTTQKEHWLGWLREYDGPGAYGRTSGKQRDARFAYNHIVEPKMLLWLIEAAGLNPELVDGAKRASAEGASLMQKSGTIRGVAPWAVLYDAIWGDDG